MKTNKEITLTTSQVADAWRVSRPTVTSRLSGVPHTKAGNSKHYELAAVVKAMSSPENLAPEQMSPHDRAHLTQALILEEKLRRMKAESVDALEVEALFCDVFKRLADAIKAWHWLPIKARRAICAQIRNEIERCNGEVAKCTFKVANPDA